MWTVKRCPDQAERAVIQVDSISAILIVCHDQAQISVEENVPNEANLMLFRHFYSILGILGYLQKIGPVHEVICYMLKTFQKQTTLSTFITTVHCYSSRIVWFQGIWFPIRDDLRFWSPIGPYTVINTI